MKALLVCSLVLVGVFARDARAEEPEGWRITFSPQSLAALSAPLTSVVVVPGGGQPDVYAAANALVIGLRASGRASLVMDAGAIGNVSTLDDAAIVTRAQALPVNEIVIVRTFPNGPGQSSAVVSVYDKSGEPLGSSSGPRGGALTTTAPPAPPAYPQPAYEPPVYGAPVYPPYAPYVRPAPQVTTSAPPPNAPSPELSQQPNTVPVTVASVGRPLQLNAMDTTTVSGVGGYYHPYGYAYSTTTFRPLCTTPCTLYLPPGSAQLRVNGDGVSPRTVPIYVPPSGADLRLRAPTSAISGSGVALVTLGTIGLAVGTAVLAVGEVGKKTTTFDGFGDAVTHTEKNHGLVVGGGVVMGVSAVMLATGITLLAVNRGGVATSTPRRGPAGGPTARLSVGAGNALVSGTF